jgi:cobalt-zinc-cadmium efflux system outer membrane protein
VSPKTHPAAGSGKSHRPRNFWLSVCMAAAVLLPAQFAPAAAGDLQLQELVDEALQNSPEILAAQARAVAAKHRVPQASSLPDPMLMTGYQNDGFTGYTYGNSSDSQWMFSASQTVPFPGKLSLKGEMAAREAEGLSASTHTVRFRVVARVKDLYYDLALAYKAIDILRDKSALFSRTEDAALARYASGMGQQQEVLMAQTEKYMLLEKEVMQKQKIQSLEAMLNTTVGRDVSAPLGRPVEPSTSAYTRSLEDLVQMAYAHSPEIKAKEQMVKAAEAKIAMARKEYYPDVTLGGTYFNRGTDQYPDMWSLTATFNVPIYFQTKQDEAVREGLAGLSEAKHELAATRLMVASAMRDNYTMIKTAEHLMELYKTALIPKNYQDYELALAGYASGKVEAITVISTLKSFLDSELLYWVQFTEREKAIARHEAIVGAAGNGS